MQYLKAAQRQYSLSPLHRALSRRLRSSSAEPPLRGRKERTAGYPNTALNRPRGLTLTRDHPLVQRGGLPRAPRRRRFLNFVSALRRMGNFGEREFRGWHERGGLPSVLKATVDRECAL